MTSIFLTLRSIILRYSTMGLETPNSVIKSGRFLYVTYPANHTIAAVTSANTKNKTRRVTSTVVNTLLNCTSPNHSQSV